MNLKAYESPNLKHILTCSTTSIQVWKD